MSLYDEDFFALETQVARDGAQAVLPYVIEKTRAQTVVDVGCGTGSWAAVAKTLGCKVIGIDGHVPIAQLVIEPNEFVQHDLESGFSCGGFDLAICMEVAEHLPQPSADNLVAGLCKAKYVLWSAAIPGQIGVNHINEQWSSWWAPFFNHYGYVGSCDVRSHFWDDRRIAGFYRQNIMMWATPDSLAEIGMEQGVFDDVHPDRALGF